MFVSLVWNITICATGAYGAVKCVYFVRLNEDMSVARGLNYEITCIIN